MAGSVTLTTHQRSFIAGLLGARTVREAASEAGIHERTGWRYLGDPDVRAELTRRQSAMLAVVTLGIVEDMTEARTVLRAIMTDPVAAGVKGAGVRVRAAAIIVDTGLRFFEVLSLADRLSALERRLDDGQ